MLVPGQRPPVLPSFLHSAGCASGNEQRQIQLELNSVIVAVFTSDYPERRS